MTATTTSSVGLLELDQLHFKNQGRIGRNDLSGAIGPIGEVGGNDQPASTSHFEVNQALIPSFDVRCLFVLQNK